MNTGGYFVPSMRDLTCKFCRDVLAGKKKLLKAVNVKWVEQVPNWKEFTTRSVWNNVKGNKKMTIYFPDYGAKRLPERYIPSTLLHFPESIF